MTPAIEERTQVDPKHIVEDGFDHVAERHAEWAARTRTEERSRYLALLMDKVQPGARVLELGCGTGRVTVPYLIDPNTGEQMGESGDIIHYLDQQYVGFVGVS